MAERGGIEPFHSESGSFVEYQQSSSDLLVENVACAIEVTIFREPSDRGEWAAFCAADPVSPAEARVVPALGSTGS